MSELGAVRGDSSGSGVTRVLLHLVLIGGMVAWGAVRLQALAAARALPPLRPTPLEVRPRYDDAAVVSDAEVRRVLRRLGLHDRGRKTAVGHIEHALRLWGPAMATAEGGVMSGREMRLRLTDNREFSRVYGSRQAPLLIDLGPGVRVRALEGTASSPHADHTLASLAEVGTPLDFPVVTPHRTTTFRAVVEQSLRDLSLNQAEPEWSALADALFLPPVHRWITSEGQEMTFDRLAGRLMREAQPQGVCSGNHRLHALVVFLRIDDQMAVAGKERILTSAARLRITGYLRGVTQTLIRHQHPDGFWNGNWPTAIPPAGVPSDVERDRLSDRLIVTGHVLEWWSLAPEEIQPPRPVVVAAARWLVRTVDHLSDAEIETNFTFLSHVGRALAQWRGVLPSEVDLADDGALRQAAQAGSERRPEAPAR